MRNTNQTRSENPANHCLPPYFTGTLFFTVLTDGRVDVTFHEYTKRGNLRQMGQRYMIGRSWSEVLPVFAPRETVRVIVRTESFNG